MFTNVKLKSFICESPEIDKRITGKRRIDIPDICVYIYAIITVPEDDSLDTVTRHNINEWLFNNIKLIDVNSIMEFLKSFPFNEIFYNYCIPSLEVIGVDEKYFNNNMFHEFSLKNNLKIMDKATIPTDKLQKADFIYVLNKKTENKLTFESKFEYFEDLPKEFILKCNLLVCTLISILSKNKISYDFNLIKPEAYLIDLCKDFTQYKSLVKSVKANFDILNEVPEEHLVSMKDVYYYIYNHLN